MTTSNLTGVGKKKEIIWRILDVIVQISFEMKKRNPDEKKQNDEFIWTTLDDSPQKCSSLLLPVD